MTYALRGARATVNSASRGRGLTGKLVTESNLSLLRVRANTRRYGRHSRSVRWQRFARRIVIMLPGLVMR
jgi:hypothetical protein